MFAVTPTVAKILKSSPLFPHMVMRVVAPKIRTSKETPMSFMKTLMKEALASILAAFGAVVFLMYYLDIQPKKAWLKMLSGRSL
jgi:hypothetical protein